jgi:hypothetical protein
MQTTPHRGWNMIFVSAASSSSRRRYIVLQPSSTIQRIASHQLTELLKDVRLKRHASVFLENDIDLVMFQTLTDEDLLTIGIFSLGARRLMLNVIQGKKSLFLFLLHN